MLTDPRPRPTPLTVVAILCLAAGALLLLSAASLILIGGFLGMNGVQVGSTDDPRLAFAFGFASLVLGVAYLALYHGFWHLRPWAFISGFLIAAAGIVTVLVGLALGFGDTASALTNTVVGVAVMGVLLLPSSQDALGQADVAKDQAPAPAPERETQPDAMSSVTTVDDGPEPPAPAQ